MYVQDTVWFAIAKYRDGVCREVFMTWSFAAYDAEWRAAREAGFDLEVWAAESFPEIDAFRKRCQTRHLEP